ncbi:MAG: hypothetical protein R6V73_13125 [Anaerolineales bacterium]|jgi:hypothetical protein
MVVAQFTLREDYWNTFELQEEDIEFLYTYLLDKEIPLTSQELISALVEERIRREKIEIDRQRSLKGDIFLPREHYSPGQSLVFPAFEWRSGQVVSSRPGRNPDLGLFDVIRVKFEDGVEKEFATGLADHRLNEPIDMSQVDGSMDHQSVLDEYQTVLLGRLEEDLSTNPNFVRIAGRWFPRALVVDVNAGHLNLAEAVLDMAGGGPLPTSELLKQLELPTNVNPKLVEFSLDLALQEDPRFDEVGPAGEVLWFLQRLEPLEVQQTPAYLQYHEMDYKRSLLTEEMLSLERELDDELSMLEDDHNPNEVEVRLIFPHWRSGTLPLSTRMQGLFPTAYETPRIRFMLVDGDSGEKFPGWVVRSKRYVFGLREWYESKGLIPGSVIWVRRGKRPGEVIVQSDGRRPSREWIRTLLVGSDGGIVFAMLKQVVAGSYDERMAIAVPDVAAVDDIWQKVHKDRVPFERIVVNTVRELAKLNPQSHVHASELYATVNIMRRCPPGPILALLSSRPWFVHVGDLHFRFDDSESG